jgi:hypothetical protein
MNREMIIILEHDGEFVDYGYIVGLEMIQSRFTNAWFPSLKLRTLQGERLQGYQYMIRPYAPHLHLSYASASSTD